MFSWVSSDVFIRRMEQHLCVVQTVDRNPFKSIGRTSRCPRTCQAKRNRRRQCLVSYLFSLVVGRKGTSGHAPLLADSFCWVSGESESDYHPAHRSTFPPDPPAPANPQQRPQSPELTGLINPLVTREELESLSLSLCLLSKWPCLSLLFWGSILSAVSATLPPPPTSFVFIFFISRFPRVLDHFLLKSH